MHLIKSCFLLACGALLMACAASAPQTAVSADVQKRVQELSPQHALVVALPDGQIRTYDGRGLQPLFDALADNGVKDAYVYDKVTGRASSLLLAYGGAKELHTGLLSQEAIPILEKYNIKYTAQKTVPYILNRSKTGSCPMETVARHLDDAQSAYPHIEQGFQQLINSAKPQNP